MLPSDIIAELLRTVDSPDKLAAGAFARSNTGEQVDPFSGDATCWCTLGALVRAAVDESILSISMINNRYASTLSYIQSATGKLRWGQTLATAIIDWSDNLVRSYPRHVAYTIWRDTMDRAYKLALVDGA